MDRFSNRREFLAKGASIVGATALGSALLPDSAEAARSSSVIVSVRDFGARGDGKKDDTEALRKAFSGIPDRGAVYLPRGDYVINGAIKMKSGTAMLGEPFGARIFPKHYDAPAVQVPMGCRVSDLTFAYDNADVQNPKEAPETISLIGNGAGYIDNITFSNAFIGVGTPKGGANCGQSVIRNLNGFVHDTMVRIDGSLDIVRIENVHCFVGQDMGTDPKSYYHNNRKCLHIKASDGTIISKSFMIFGKIFLLKEPGDHGAGLSTYLSQCWCEGMTSHGIQINDGSRISISDTEITCAYAKALIEVNNGAIARINSCYFRDSMNSIGVKVNEGSGALLSNCEFFGSPGFTGIEINSAERSIISNSYLHHCEVGIKCTENADNYVITGNQISLNNAPLVLIGGKNKIVSENL